MVVTATRVPVADGVDLRVLDWPGVRRPYLLVHGLASNALLWRGVATALAAEGHRVLAVDLRGHGESDAPASGHGTGAAVADLAAIVEALGLGTPVLVGQSWGGNVVLAYAAAGHPAYGVGCVDGGWLHPADRFATFAACWAALEPPPLNGLTASGFAARLASAHPGWSSDAVEATVRNLRVGPDGRLHRRLALEYHEAIVRSLYDDAPRRWYHRVGVPVLLLPAGRPDGQQGDLVAEAARLLPRATVKWYADGDHDLHAQYPAAVSANLLGLA